MDNQRVETTLYSLDESVPAGAERRTSDRHLSLLRVGSLTIGDRKELCLIKNVSAGGMLIRAYSSIEPDTRITVELKEGEPVSDTARWSEGDCVGINFDEPIDIIGLLSSPLGGQCPRMPRIEVHCTAWVREGATVHRTKAVDISQGGIRVTSAKELAIGAEVIVTVVGLAPIAGAVRWNNNDSYGVMFNRALDLGVLVAWLQDQQERERARMAG